MSLILDKEYFTGHTNSIDLEEHFKVYCEWCWRHGYGNCDACRKIYNKLYIPLRKKELQIKNGLIETDKAESEG